jgi:hypothetical protein
MDPNVALPFTSSVFSFVFAAFLIDAYGACMFMPKRRLIRYECDRPRAAATLRGLAVAAIAIPVNFVVSLPGAASDLVKGRLHSRGLLYT